MLDSIGTLEGVSIGPMCPEPTTGPRIENCLAHAVLRHPDAWLGQSSPTALSVFLIGAEYRAAAMEPTLPAWRIHGPLGAPDFDEPLLARTGHPRLAIKWPTAMELLHLSMRVAREELRERVEKWFREGRVSERAVGHSIFEDMDPDRFWQSLAARPPLFLGGASGWHLSWFLAGMIRGGDTLGLPPLPMAREIADAIHIRSQKSYGSKFGAFRICSTSELLAWAGLEGNP